MVITILKAEADVGCSMDFSIGNVRKKTSQLLSFGQKCNNQQASKRCPNDNGIEPQLAKKIFPRFGFAKWKCFEVL